MFSIEPHAVTSTCTKLLWTALTAPARVSLHSINMIPMQSYTQLKPHSIHA